MLYRGLAPIDQTTDHHTIQSRKTCGCLEPLHYGRTLSVVIRLIIHKCNFLITFSLRWWQWSAHWLRIVIDLWMVTSWTELMLSSILNKVSVTMYNKSRSRNRVAVARAYDRKKKKEWRGSPNDRMDFWDVIKFTFRKCRKEQPDLNNGWLSRRRMSPQMMMSLKWKTRTLNYLWVENMLSLQWMTYFNIGILLLN